MSDAMNAIPSTLKAAGIAVTALVTAAMACACGGGSIAAADEAASADEKAAERADAAREAEEANKVAKDAGASR